jgi:hypothetical protein
MNNINPIWLRYGMFYGLASILLSMIIYYVYSAGLGMQFWISMAIMILFLVYAGKAQKKANNGVLGYGEALLTTFLTGFVGTTISVLFTIIWINLIDPSLVEKLTEMALDTARSMMEMFNLPEDQMAAAMEKAEEDSVNAFTPLKQIFSIFSSSIFTIIIAAIISIFLKKEEDINKIDINSLGNPS